MNETTTIELTEEATTKLNALKTVARKFAPKAAIGAAVLGTSYFLSRYLVRNAELEIDTETDE